MFSSDFWISEIFSRQGSQQTQLRIWKHFLKANFDQYWNSGKGEKKRVFLPPAKDGIPRYDLISPCVSQWLLVSEAQPNLIILNTTYVICQLLHASQCTEPGDRIKIFSYNGKRENCSHLEAADCSFSKRLDAQFNWLCFTRKNIVHSLKHQNSNFQDICSFFELQHE